MSAWWRRDAAAAADDARWVLLDVESSGLDPTRDRLLAIAAIALTRQGGAPRLVFGDSFEVLLRQPEASVDKANILVHGIGVGAQRGGAEPAQALAALEAAGVGVRGARYGQASLEDAFLALTHEALRDD